MNDKISEFDIEKILKIELERISNAIKICDERKEQLLLEYEYTNIKLRRLQNSQVYVK